MQEPTPEPHKQPDKPLFLMRGSPLVAGGKARLMSNRKVKPQPAEPREVTGPEEKGYTSEPRRALLDAGEAPSSAWVDAHAELAAKYDRLRREKQAETARESRKALTIEHRMLDAQRRAKLRRIDVTHEMHVMRKMLAKNNERNAATRLETLEARLDGVLDEAA